MCGRYSGKDIERMAFTIAHITGEPYEVVLARYRRGEFGGIRYNIAPSQNNVVIAPRDKKPGTTKMKWGNFVSFAPASPPTFLINARSETALEKRTFSKAFKERRCLVPADGFYEWKRDAKGRSKQAFYFQRKGGAAYCMAGLYWPAEADQPERYIVLTTAPNELLEPIHDRMPVILPEEAANRWLDTATSGEDARSLCLTYPAAEMTAYPVSSVVNSAKNDLPECIVPVMAEPEIEPQQELF
jgi:putative SOS response-associated peptidase YedK